MRIKKMITKDKDRFSPDQYILNKFSKVVPMSFIKGEEPHKLTVCEHDFRPSSFKHYVNQFFSTK